MITFAPWPKPGRLITALFLTMTFAGCAELPKERVADPPPRPVLPEPPATFGRPVPLPVPRAGQSAKEFAARAIAAARIANDRLEHDRMWYADVQHDFGGTP